MKNNIIQEEAISGMMEGVKLCSDLIRPTYGGAGTNVIVETKLYPFHAVYNDAQSIVQAIRVTDKAQKIGVESIKELCDKADKVSGDARKTTIIMADTILQNGYKSEMKKLDLKRELDKLIPFIESEIDQRTKSITVDNVKGVATTASESEEIGSLLQEIYKQIGPNGILTVEGSKTYDTNYVVTNGIRFESTGMLSSEMVHDEEAIADKRKETKAVYENPLILVTKKKITTDEEINPLLREMRDMGKKDLVIFTNDMDSGVASMLVGLHKSKDFNILIIKAPTLWQDFVFEDFAKCTGSTIIHDASGLTLKNLQMQHLGTCGRIEVDGEDTILNGIADISDHIENLSNKGDDDSNLRLSWLATKSATLKLGSNSETDLSYKRLKCNDANRSTYLALKYGVVKGGGICLWDISNSLPDTEAGKIMLEALRAPLEQARKNYGLEINPYTEIITEDIVDSSMVIKRAVRNAVGLASTLLTANAIVYIPDLTESEIALQKSLRQDNPFG